MPVWRRPCGAGLAPCPHAFIDGTAGWNPSSARTSQNATVAELKTHYRDERLLPFVTPVHTSAENWGSVPKVYLYTKQYPAVSYALQQRMTAGVTLARSVELDTSHSPFCRNPR